MQPRLKPQDVLLALKLVARRNSDWTQLQLASSLHMSVSEINHSLKRLVVCSLFNAREHRVVCANLLEFLVSGLRYVFPTQLGLLGKGMPTAYSVRPLAERLRLGEEDGVVWAVPHGDNQIFGRVIEPLYESAPQAAAEDPVLHEYLALADALRVGRARERAMAREELTKRLTP
ncbi:hypothetical protein [Pendulispora albinea]|uniref:MarR family transcriptional regulator n=1 Tax=Pendulispora albinea TaxID=2741071 RepID=A0ABZ2M570_9BACT